MTPSTKGDTSYLVFFQEFSLNDHLFKTKGIYLMAGIRNQATGEVIMYSNLNAQAIREVLTELSQGQGVLEQFFGPCQ